MKITRIERKSTVFILKWTDIERLLDSLAKHFPVSSVSVSCSDGLLRVFDNHEELKTFNNSERTAIVRLGIISRSVNHSERFKISLSNSDGNNVDVELDADEPTGVAIDHIYQDFLDAVRPWYSRIARVQVGLLISFFALIAFAGPTAIELLRTIFSSNNWSESVELKNFTIAAFPCMMPILFNGDLNRLRSKFFPVGTFAFADGETRHQKNEMIRNGVIVASLISIVTTIVLSRIL